MGLVENHRVAGRQQLGQAFVAQHDVGKEQMMVDDDNVGIQCILARLHDETFLMKRAVRPETVVAGGRHERPDRGVLRHIGEERAVAALARLSEGDDLAQMPRVIARRQAILA